MGIYLPQHAKTHILQAQVVHLAMTVQCQERDLPVEKRGVCQVRVVYFWASSGCLFTLDDCGPTEEEQRALLGFTDG